jgi:hypothetical protein
MKKPLNILITEETLNTLLKAKDNTGKSLSVLVEDSIKYYVLEMGLTPLKEEL